MNNPLKHCCGTLLKWPTQSKQRRVDGPAYTFSGEKKPSAPEILLRSFSVTFVVESWLAEMRLFLARGDALVKALVGKNLIVSK